MLLRPFLNGLTKTIPTVPSARWATGHRLPGMFRTAFWFGLYTRQTVPVEEKLTRLWYFHYLQPKSRFDRWRKVLSYHLLHKWLIIYNFSMQDTSVMLNQRFDWPEKLSGTDAEIIQWRKLVVTKRFGGRNAPFQYRNPDGLAPDEVPLDRIYRQSLRQDRAGR